MKKRVFIFDLDGTVIDSEHRTPRDAQGKLILKEWFAMATPANIAKDTLLPLASLFRKAKRKHHHIVICTARTLSEADREFLANPLEWPCWSRIKQTYAMFSVAI